MSIDTNAVREYWRKNIDLICPGALNEIVDLCDEVDRLQSRIAEYQALVLRRSGASSLQEWLGDWDLTEESADAYINRLRGRIAELELVIVKAVEIVLESRRRYPL